MEPNKRQRPLLGPHSQPIPRPISNRRIKRVGTHKARDCRYQGTASSDILTLRLYCVTQKCTLAGSKVCFPNPS